MMDFADCADFYDCAGQEAAKFHKDTMQTSDKERMKSVLRQLWKKEGSRGRERERNINKTMEFFPALCATCTPESSLAFRAVLGIKGRNISSSPQLRLRKLSNRHNLGSPSDVHMDLTGGLNSDGIKDRGRPAIWLHTHTHTPPSSPVLSTSPQKNQGVFFTPALKIQWMKKRKSEV